MHLRTPYTESADDRARRFETRRTPCTQSADYRARRFQTHRNPCSICAYDRADKRCTPCTSTGTSPRARMAPSCKGLSSASRPSWSPPLLPAPCPRLHRPRRGTLSRSVAKSTASLPAPRGVQRPTCARDATTTDARILQPVRRGHPPASLPQQDGACPCCAPCCGLHTYVNVTRVTHVNRASSQTFFVSQRQGR